MYGFRLFSRGKEEKNATASFAFVGNINQSVDVLLKTSHLFEPFPEAMGMGTAFLDRIHCYSPGWEIPKYKKKILLPLTSAVDLGTVPPGLVGSFNLIFYSSAEEAAFKALGVE